MNFDEKLKLFCRGALECLLWVNELEGEEVDSESESALNRLCEKFVRTFEWELDTLASFEQDFTRYSHYGHDFVLTWNGSGCGFWDMFCGYSDDYSRATIDLLALPLVLALHETRRFGELETYVEKTEAGEEIVKFELPKWPEHLNRKWLDKEIKKWMPEFPNFVTRHVPWDLRAKFVKAMRKLNYIEKVKQH